MTYTGPNNQRGVALVTAIFLLVVLFALGTYVVTLSSVSQSAPIQGLQGARALGAARSGVEWGVYRAIADGDCSGFPRTISFSGDGLRAFEVEVDCVAPANPSDHKERNQDIPVFLIQATARYGQLGEADFVRRRIEVRTSPSPP